MVLDVRSDLSPGRGSLASPQSHACGFLLQETCCGPGTRAADSGPILTRRPGCPHSPTESGAQGGYVTLTQHPKVQHRQASWGPPRALSHTPDVPGSVTGRPTSCLHTEKPVLPRHSQTPCPVPTVDPFLRLLGERPRPGQGLEGERQGPRRPTPHSQGATRALRPSVTLLLTSVLGNSTFK